MLWDATARGSGCVLGAAGAGLQEIMENRPGGRPTPRTGLEPEVTDLDAEYDRIRPISANMGGLPGASI